MAISKQISSFISNSNMIRFIIKTILSALPVLIVLVSVNYFCDPANIFHHAYEEEMIKIIYDGYHVTNISNYDDRIFQRKLIQGLSDKPDYVIIGSSRSMLIRGEYINNTSTINNSVSGASIEDMIAIYQIYNELDKLPKKIIMGIDPWTFNENNRQGRWCSLIDEYNRYHDGDDKQVNPLYEYIKFMEIISPSYFQGSMEYIGMNIFNERTKPEPTYGKYNETNTKLIDGSMVYARSIREVTKMQLERKVMKYLQEDIYGIEDFDCLSPKITKALQQLVDTIRKKEIEIIFFLTPYHPTVYKVIGNKYPMVIKSEAFIIEYAKANKIKLLGSFDPHKYDFNESSFYDGMHPKEPAIKKIFLDEFDFAK